MGDEGYSATPVLGPAKEAESVIDRESIVDPVDYPSEPVALGDDGASQHPRVVAKSSPVVRRSTPRTPPRLMPQAMGTLESSHPVMATHLLGVATLFVPLCSFAGYRLGGIYGAGAGTLAGGAAVNIVRGAISSGSERTISLTYGVVGFAAAGYLVHLAMKE